MKIEKLEKTESGYVVNSSINIPFDVDNKLALEVENYLNAGGKIIQKKEAVKAPSKLKKIFTLGLVR